MTTSNLIQLSNQIWSWIYFFVLGTLVDQKVKVGFLKFVTTQGLVPVQIGVSFSYLVQLCLYSLITRSDKYLCKH